MTEPVSASPEPPRAVQLLQAAQTRLAAVALLPNGGEVIIPYLGAGGVGDRQFLEREAPADG